MSKGNPTTNEKEEFDEHLKNPDMMDNPIIDVRSEGEQQAGEDGRRAGKIVQANKAAESDDD